MTDLEIRGTNRYDSLDAAQRASIQAIAARVAHSVRAGIQNGSFAVIDGVVRLAGTSKMDANREGESDAVSA